MPESEPPRRGLSERECAAIQKVREVLNVTSVRQHDDGSENGLYDVELGVADGTRIAMEITSLQDEIWHRARSALDQWASEFEGASLSRHWIVIAAAEGVRIRGLAAVLEPLLLDVEQADRSSRSSRPRARARSPAASGAAPPVARRLSGAPAAVVIEHVAARMSVRRSSLGCA